MTDGILRLRHVKIPVTDVARSTKWYRSLLDLEPLETLAERAGTGEVRDNDPFGSSLDLSTYDEPRLGG